MMRADSIVVVPRHKNLRRTICGEAFSGHAGYCRPCWSQHTEVIRCAIPQGREPTWAARESRGLRWMKPRNFPTEIHYLSTRAAEIAPEFLPELKINAITPESVTAMENYWRAL